jgi:uncharacterized glyoxalase superfamily protein PhnB
MNIHEVFPYLRVKGAAKAVEHYKQAFGAIEKFRLVEPSGRVGHVELQFGPTIIMLSDEYPEMNILGPQSIGGTSFTIHLHVDNADAALEQAVAAGATLIRPASDAFYGERSGTVRDPFGHEWMLGHSIEEVTPEEMQRRYTALMNG